MCSTDAIRPDIKDGRQLQLGTRYGAVCVALLTLSTTLTIPHLQSRRDALGCDAMCYGSFTSARSFLSVIGSAIMGRLSDSTGPNGRKICMVVGTVATLVGMLIAGSTYSIEGMWLSMIPGALFQQNFNILKALLSDLHAEGNAPSERASAVGMLGMAAGLAFMAGPLTGSTVLKTFEHANGVGMVFAALSLAIIFLLPSPSKQVQTSQEKKGFMDFLNVKAARSPGAILFMAIRVCMALAFHVFQTIWSVALKQKFDFGPADWGMFMSFIGLTYALSQGFLAKFLLESLGGNTSNKVRVRMILGCCVSLGVGRYAAYHTESLAAVYFLFAAIVTALGMVNTILTADTSYLASSDEIGSLFGLLASVESVAGMVGPILGGSLAYIHPVHAPLLCVAGLYVFVFALVSWGYEDLVLTKRKTDSEKKTV
jgi:MFS family permease